MAAQNIQSVHRIVIVGGGAAGLELATSLGHRLGRKGLAEVLLLDATATHVWKPLLHEVAAGTMDESEQVDYLGQAFRNHFRFRLGKMDGLDRKSKRIYASAIYNENGEEIVPRRTFDYDTLVMAVGSVSNSFGIKGVDEHCLFLDTTAQAFKFQKKLVESYIKTHAGSEAKKAKGLAIAIVGGGATGVELSAELHEVTEMLAIYGLEKSSNVKLTLIEASPQLLPALPPKLALATQEQLAKLDIDLKLGCRVVEVTAEGIKTADGGMIPAELKVWAAGIKAPDWMRNLDGLETNQINQLVVNPCLQTADDNIFAIGDCAACPWPGHKGNVPPRAQAAHQQAETLCKTLVNRLRGLPPVKYHYHDYGSLVSLGEYTTIGNLMGNLMGTVTIGGFIARVVYLSLYKMHQVAIHGYYRTALLTLSNLFRRNAHAGIKMH